MQVITGQYRFYPDFLNFMYNRLYKFLKENNILYGKRFGFQRGYFTNDAIVQLVDKIFYSFEKKEQLSLEVFIDLSKAFDTVDHCNLLKKLKLYGITDKNLAWFESYLSNNKQCIHIGENSKTDFKYVICGVSQRSILGPLLTLVYVNNLPNALAYKIQLCLPMILIFSLIIRRVNTSLQL